MIFLVLSANNISDLELNSILFCLRYQDFTFLVLGRNLSGTFVCTSSNVRVLLTNDFRVSNEHSLMELNVRGTI
jgi:hypothetical protein